jgi:RimJ/RimL family protein N-acetyltransferase
MQICVTNDIHLSELLSSDQVTVVEHLKEKEIYDRTLRIPYPYTEADFQAWLKIAAEATQQQGRPVHWAIRTRGDYPIGGCGLQFQPGHGHRAEIGYWLAKPCWGRGIMTAVVGRVCACAFEEFGLVKVTAQVYSANAASARVLEKCGFGQEGYLRKHAFKEGKYVDVRAFALLKPGV